MLVFFTVLDAFLKFGDKRLAICLCAGLYLYLLLAMVFFKVREDWDASNSFLAAVYSMFYEISETDGQRMGVSAIAVFLGTLKNIVVGGKPPTNRLLPSSSNQSMSELERRSTFPRRS